MLNCNTGEPLYAIIAAELKREIVSGELKPGSMLSSENSLTGRFSASRETVRKSLKQLENDGYIYSRPGKGYFVNMPEYDKFTLFLPEDDAESVLRHISVVVPTEAVKTALNLPARKKTIEIIRITYKNGRPAALDLRYYPYDKGRPTIESEIDYAVFPEIAAANTSAFAFRVQMEITSGPAGERAAQYLECRKEEPVLVVRRILIGHENERIGYGVKLMLPSFGPLKAESGTLLK